MKGERALMTKEKHTLKYMQVVECMKDFIEKGILKPRDLLPSEPEIMEKFGVSSITVRKAMQTLAQEGIVYRVKGRGTYVADPNQTQETAEDAKKVYLIFDVEAALDTSLTQIVQGIQRYYKNKKRLLVLENYAFLNEYLRRGPADEDAGLIIYINAMDDEHRLPTLRQLNQAGIKFVCIDRYLGHYPVNYVGCNNHDGTYAAVDHLAALGHKQIGFMHERRKISSEQERLEGYIHGMEDQGLKSCIAQPYEMDQIDQCVNALLERRHTAMVCANDYTAAVLIQAIKTAGMSVPQDVSVVGFDDSETYRFHQPALTTVRQDFHVLGYESARALNKLMAEDTQGCTRIYTPVHLIVRESTGPCCTR